MSARDKVIQAIRDFRFWNYGMDEVDPNSEFAEWVPDLADAICAAIDDQPFHVIDVTETGWTLKHPLDCRADLFACLVNRAAEALDAPPALPGRYRVGLRDGELEVGPEVEAPARGEPTFDEIAEEKRADDV